MRPAARDVLERLAERQNQGRSARVDEFQAVRLRAVHGAPEFGVGVGTDQGGTQEKAVVLLGQADLVVGVGKLAVIADTLMADVQPQRQLVSQIVVVREVEVPRPLGVARIR